MARFEGEDLIVINLDTIERYGLVQIQNVRINHFRDVLRKRGMIFDLGIREFETLRHRYPSNIRIESQSITIIRSDSFVSTFYRRRSGKGTNLSALITIWDETT